MHRGNSISIEFMRSNILNMIMDIDFIHQLNYVLQQKQKKFKRSFKDIQKLVYKIQLLIQSIIIPFLKDLQ
jgi:hypothetical protein